MTDRMANAVLACAAARRAYVLTGRDAFAHRASSGDLDNALLRYEAAQATLDAILLEEVDE